MMCFIVVVSAAKMTFELCRKMGRSPKITQTLLLIQERMRREVWKGIRELLEEEDESMLEGSRENGDPDWEGSNVSNRKHDPAVLRLYLASVAMCWECTLQTHAHTQTHTSHFSRPFDSCERSVCLWLLTDERVEGGFPDVCNLKAWLQRLNYFRGSVLQLLSGLIVDSKRVFDMHVLVHVWPLVLSSGPLQPLFSSLKMPLLAAGGRRTHTELTTSAAHCVISPETGKNKLINKKINMETHLGRTNERTAWSKPHWLTLLWRIFRSHVTGVYQYWKLSTSHLLFCLHTSWGI